MVAPFRCDVKSTKVEGAVFWYTLGRLLGGGGRGVGATLSVHACAHTGQASPRVDWLRRACHMWYRPPHHLSTLCPPTQIQRKALNEAHPIRASGTALLP
eukprot:24659-Chlamydomonas_euryale.AAC.1